MPKPRGAGRDPDRPDPAGRPRRRTVQTIAGMLDITLYGPDDGEAIVLTSHGMGSRESFDEVARHLAATLPDRRIVSWSRPGCGDSPDHGDLWRAADPLVHEATVVLPALMAVLGIRRADLVGHADGATVSLVFAARFPERTGQVVAIAPRAFMDAQFRAMTESLPPGERESGLSERLAARHAQAQSTYDNWLSRCRTQLRQGWSALREIYGMAAPLLLVQGLDDEFASADQLTAVAEAVAGPVDWVLFRNQGHFPQHDDPERVFRVIDGFLQRGPAPTRARPGLPIAGLAFTCAATGLPPSAATAAPRL